MSARFLRTGNCRGWARVPGVIKRRDLIVIGAVTVAMLPVSGRAFVTAQTVTATETDFKITLSAHPRARTVVFVVKNASPIVHELSLRGGGKSWHTNLIQPHTSAKLRTTLKKGVRYRVWCTIDSHADFGMNRYFVAR